MWIAVGHGPVLWGVDYGNDVWFKMIGQPPPPCEDLLGEIAEEVPTGMDVPTPISQLDVGKNGHAWALGPDNQVLWRMGVSEDNT